MDSAMKKKVRIGNHEEGEDRISKLSDEVIHKIMYYLDSTKLAIQTSILSNRWRLIWTTLPFLDFDDYESPNYSSFLKLIDHVLSHRNHESQVLTLKLDGSIFVSQSLVENLIEYAISHNVVDLYVYLQSNMALKLSKFSSNSIKKLKLKMKLDFGKGKEVDCWDLPTLTTLHLEACFDPILLSGDYFIMYKLPEACLICLRALRTLSLKRGELPESSLSLILPDLTTLRLIRCRLPQAVWNFTALLSLELDDIKFPTHMKTFVCELVSLQNLTLSFPRKLIHDCSFTCPRLMNLKISTTMSTCTDCNRKIMVIANKVRNVESIGIFPVTFEVNELENVNIKFWAIKEFKKTRRSSEMWDECYHQFRAMFSEMGSVQILALDLATIKALSAVSKYFERVSSPFYKLKCVKLPEGYKESRITKTLRQYLLGGSPTATICTTLPTKNVISLVAPASSMSPNVVLGKPLANPTKELVVSQDLHKNNVTTQVAPVSAIAQNVVLEDPLANPTKDLVDSQDVRKNNMTTQVAPVSAIAQNVVLEDPLANPTKDLVDSQDENVIHLATPFSRTAQNVVLEEPLALPTKELVDPRDVHKNDMIPQAASVSVIAQYAVLEEHVVHNAVEENDKVGSVNVPVARAGNDRACSLSGNSGYGFWQGHEVNSEFVGLLDLIMKKYPETFEHLTCKSKFYAMKLNMLCSSVNAFIKMSLSDVTSVMIVEYRGLLADFERWGFNVNWLTARLNYIEQLQFSHQELHSIDTRIDDAKTELQDLLTRIDDTKSKLQELQILQVEKMTYVEKAFGNMGTSVAANAGYIGDGLFSDP